MKLMVWVYTLILFLCVAANATLTVHIQSPWRNDASKDGYFLHILGSAGGSYNALYGETSPTITTAEGDGWFSYTWDKNVSDFQEWMSFTVSIYPNTADQNFNNNNGIQWKEAGEFKMATLFGTDTEVWLYTDPADRSYTKSFVAPGSKLVWFKSPWGNKALPQMILGEDSVMMRFAQDDPGKCGWFYGAVSPAMLARNPLQSVHFIRLNTPYMSVPAQGVVELGDYFSVLDTVFVDGTAGATVDSKIGVLGECFDSTRTLHVYHPWRTNTSFRDTAVYFTVGNNIVNNPAPMVKDEYPYWYRYDFAPETVNSSNWNSTMAQFNLYRCQNEWPQVTYFAEGARPLASVFFPTGVYEAWLFTNSSGKFDLSFTPLEPKVVRLMSPWDNMTPMMIVPDDTIKMGPFHSDTCGWYQGISYKHVDSWEVYFRQAFGFEYYSRNGLDTIPGELINLDSIFAETDTVWMTTVPFRVSSVYPKVLGICPSMKISAMVVDWAGESFDDSIDVDFGGIYNGNDYTTVTYLDSLGTLATNAKCGGLVKGMVQDTLVNGAPARVDSSVYPWGMCSAAHEIEKWFIPETIVVDGNEYKNSVCRDIDLTMDEEGFWLADISQPLDGTCGDSLHPGFYPIDDFEYLYTADSSSKIPNPKNDKYKEHQGCKHNYSYAMKVTAEFKYVKGQYFEFRGDDDVWVYINNRLVVDIGGCHNPEEGAVNLDTIGKNDPSLKLVEGETYPFHIFYSERNATGANFKMRTSINLQTQRTYFSKQKESTDGSVEYEFHQLLVDKSISCDVSSVQSARDQLAPSLFILKGGSLPADGVTLESGPNYGGICISENMASFKVDTSAFVNSRKLSPGKYALYCFLQSDPSQYQVVTFTVPEYPLPDIAFVDMFHVTDSAFFDPAGYTLRGDLLGSDGGKNDTLLAHVTYPDTVPIRVALLFGTTVCGEMESGADVNCVQELNLNTRFPLSFLDKDNQRVTTISTDSLGYASFYVVGDSAMVDAFFTIDGGGVNNTLTWANIHFKEPPVPFALKASMYDVNGDGIPDSLSIPFSQPFKDVVPDTLSWSFGGTEFHTTVGMENIWPMVLLDSVISLYDPAGLREDVFTGVSDQVYSGSLQYHYTYTDEDSGEEVKLSMNSSIQDKVGPVVLSATIETVSKEVSAVKINLSEGIDTKLANGKTAFIFYRDTVNFMDSLEINSADANAMGTVFKVYFRKTAAGVLPAVGDYVRIAPGELTDRSGNVAHLNNPKVRIVGEQRTEIKSPGVVTVGDETEPWPYSEPIVAISVPSNKSVHDIIDSLGKPGFLLNFNIGELATSMIMGLPSGADKDSALALIKIKWEGYYFSQLGNFVNKATGTVSCNDKTVFYNASDPEKSNCYDNPGNVFFEWNARSDKGRLVGTGAYISKLKVKIVSGRIKAGESDDTYTIGIKRSKQK